MKIERFEDINAWQLARGLTREVYAFTGEGDFSRDFGLRDQIRRAAGSVMHNIAEGFDAGSDAEFTRFLRYAQRSCTEVQSELYVALDQKYLNEQQFNQLYELSNSIHSKIGGFIKYLKQSVSPSSKTVPSPLSKLTKDELTKN
ncbi:MAG: four helix bundle protein [Lentisphaerota bacterium]